MAQELLMALVRRASAEQAIAFASLADGLQLLVYPLERGLVVGVGREGERAQRIDAAWLLQRRAGDMARFGPWLPACLKDGRWFLLRRVAAFDPEVPALDQEQLDAAEELLS
ncbi:hypothetical protein [Duganella radicis]|uniref:Uncharacterized protein n=1 Tax=Duganella radicis TaxID=551988 RepID=A0A6L6PSX0_9BURK|nr:hypothetical protein [Duganella radicis]MTV41741.1 hypothetical protein [Duganella radicis]